MNTLALVDACLLEISFSVTVPDINFGLVPGTGIAHLADEDVEVTITIYISYFTGVSVNNVTELVSYPLTAVPLVPVCIAIHVTWAEDHLGSASFYQLAGGALCKCLVAVDNIFPVIGSRCKLVIDD